MSQCDTIFLPGEKDPWRRCGPKGWEELRPLFRTGPRWRSRSAGGEYDGVRGGGNRKDLLVCPACGGTPPCRRPHHERGALRSRPRSSAISCSRGIRSSLTPPNAVHPDHLFHPNLILEIRQAADREAEMRQIADFLFGDLLDGANQNLSWVESARNAFVGVLRVIVECYPYDN